MIEPERRKFDEIVERGKLGVLLNDDFEWLIAELDSYSKAWKTERENMRKLTETTIGMIKTQERLTGALKTILDKIQDSEDLEYEVRIAREIISAINKV